MIWHIVGKDWKLLWRMVVGVALINWIERFARSSMGQFPGRFVNFALVITVNTIGNIALLATALLIAFIVQQDPIPGLRQDWLVRPIRRRDLLLSKLVFVAALVQGPILVAEVIQCLAAGFPFGQAISAPLSRSLFMLLAFDLPMIAFAALTRNLAEAVGAGVLVGLATALFMNASLVTSVSLDVTGTAWVTDSVRSAWGVAAAAAILCLLYFRRKTFLARWTFGAATLVWFFAAWLPWQTAFAIQQRFSPQPAAADPVQLSFYPGAGKIHLGKRSLDVDLDIPIEANGLADGEVLMIDRATSRLTPPDGRTAGLGSASWLQGYGNGPFHWPVSVPTDIYDRARDQPVRLEIDYSLTVMRANRDQTIPAVGGERWVPDLGRCATGTNGTLIFVGCLKPGLAACATVSVEDARSGARLAGDPDCRSNYAPYLDRIGGDSMSRFASSFALPRTDDLKDIQMALRVLRPEAHFTRKVVIPDIRLSDWRAE